MAEQDISGELAGFRRTGRGGAAARFGSTEAQLLRLMVGQVADLLGDDPPGAAGVDPFAQMLGLSENSELPDDPVLARLLPDAYRDDQDASAEFRRYTEHDLRSGKVTAAQTVLDTLPGEGGEVRLTADQAQAWLRSVNDVRLALGVRMGVTEDPEEMERLAGQGGPRAAALWIYDWLSYLLGTLVDVLSFDDEAQAPDTLWTMLTISRTLHDKIVAHARADHPDEACGVIAGPAGTGRAERFIPMVNAERSPTFYRFDSMEQLRVWREMDDRDEEPVVIYHSHTATEAYPSRTDISYASEPGAHYVLVSTRDAERAEFRSFRIRDGAVTEEEVRVTEE
jgi:[CysO sulfur-carrier protein]-S-L-cysteine hydrolase